MNKRLIILTLVFFSISRLYGQNETKAAVDSAAALGRANIDTAYKNLYPRPIGWTSDYEHILTNEQIHVLDSLISDFEKRATIQIAIVSIGSSVVSLPHFDDFVTELGTTWGIGEKEKNNGIIIGVSSGLRRIRISNGYGVEEKLTDAITKQIIDDIMVPEFRLGNYFGGLVKGLTAIMAKLE